jgi:hypothetical protein
MFQVFGLEDADPRLEFRQNGCRYGLAFHPSRDGQEFKLQLVFVTGKLKLELLTNLFFARA